MERARQREWIMYKLLGNVQNEYGCSDYFRDHWVGAFTSFVLISNVYAFEGTPVVFLF